MSYTNKHNINDDDKGDGKAGETESLSHFSL